MQAIEYKTKDGTKQYRPKMSTAEYMSAGDEYQGFCLACGAEAYGVEPDARQYKCEVCSAPKVYGLEELLMMGLLVIGEDGE